VEARGLCKAHYQRHMLRLKKPHLIGRASSAGGAVRFAKAAATYDGEDCLVWPFSRDRKGYGQIRLDQKTWVASRYVCTLAHGEPPTPEHHAAHSCNNGKGGCVNAQHLSWKTPLENAHDRSIAGTCGKGKKGPLCKLDEQQVREIRKRKGLEATRDLAARYGVSPTQVGRIQRRELWAWLPDAA